MINFKLGCDPELFLVRNEKIISAHDIVPGTKEKPHKLPNGGSVLVDGVALEFNTPPAETGEQFKDAVLSTIDDIKQILPKDISFSQRTIYQFDEEYWKTLPESCKTIGCDPSFYNPVYMSNDGLREKTEDMFNKHNYPAFESSTGLDFLTNYLKTNRVAWVGGHVHLGWMDSAPESKDIHFVDCATIAKLMLHLSECLEVKKHNDYVLLDNHKYKYKRRTVVDPTNFRPKPYGVELRSPDNSWVFDGMKYKYHLPNMFNRIKRAFHHVIEKESNYFELYTSITLYRPE